MALETILRQEDQIILLTEEKNRIYEVRIEKVFDRKE